MSLETLVSISDVEARLRRAITDDEMVTVLTLIDDAAILVESDADLTVVEDLATGALSDAAVRMVLANMVKRALTGFDGVTSSQTGPFQVTYSNPDNSVFLKASERAALSAVKAPRARTVRMGY